MTEEAVDAPPEMAPSPKAIATPLEDLMSMLNSASAVSQEATKAADQARKEADVANQKLVKGRRKSRELEESIFDGMTLKDVDKLRVKFDEIDTDGSGAIDMDELKDLLLKCGKSASNDQLKSLIEKFDDNGDGVLQFDEFRNMIGKWDDILAELDGEKARLEAALAAAEHKPYSGAHDVTAA